MNHLRQAWRKLASYENERTVYDEWHQLQRNHPLGEWTFVIGKTAAAGAAGTTFFATKQIALAPWAVEQLSTEKLIDTVRHEAAHALAGAGAGHGPRWKAMCYATGADPNATFADVEVDPGYKYIAECPNCGPQGGWFRKPRSSFLCRECRASINVVPKVARRICAMVKTAGKPAWEMSEAEFRALEPRLVYHATTYERDLNTLLTEGVRMSNVPNNLARQRYESGEYSEFAPGAGAGRGLYVARPLYHVFGFGAWVVGIEVSPGDLDFPPEASYHREYGTIDGALNSISGAMIVRDIPASRVHQMNKARFTHYVNDAWGFATDPRWTA